MHLGGFVIHGNSRSTLGRCLQGLTAVCDEVVAVDSFSTDGSFEIARASGVRQVRMKWQGYGAAREAAVTALGSSSDYLFFLDSDEWLSPGAVDVIRPWKESSPRLPVYTVRRRNWAWVQGKHFLYRTDTRARLVRRDVGIWKRSMIVHEALPRLQAERSGASIEHDFIADLTRRAEKDLNYALLWAVQNADSARAPKPEGLQRAAHFLRDLLVGGALFRGGLQGGQSAWAVARYHAKKYALLKAVRQGHFGELLELYRQDRLSELFEHALALSPAEVLRLS
jgi:(heptosyl)LPS beta-1,4-glucosyltransferase